MFSLVCQYLCSGCQSAEATITVTIVKQNQIIIPVIVGVIVDCRYCCLPLGHG